jgi:hypothetical protein
MDAAHEVITYPGWHYDYTQNAYETTGPVEVYRQDWSRSYTELLTYTLTGGWSPWSSYVTGGAPNGSEFITDTSTTIAANVVIQSLSRSLLDQSGQVVTELDYVNFTSTAYAISSAQFGSASNYLESDATFDPMGRPEATISPSGTVSFTTYNGVGEAASQWAGTTTAATPAARATAIANFRNWLASSQSEGQTSYNVNGTRLFLVSSSVYNLDGGVTATTEYVDSNSAHNRTTALGYDWRDQETYVVNPPDAAGVTYTMSTYEKDKVSGTNGTVISVTYFLASG